MFRTTLCAAFFILFMLSCSTSQFAWKTESESEGEEKKQGALWEDFDPLSLNDDDIVVPSAEREYQTGLEERPEQEGIPSEEEGSGGEMVQGYRIQLLATGDEAQAREEKRKAIFNFEESVYLDFESSLYKLRVGDCLTKREAEDLREKAIQRGFRDAWIVRSRVYRQRDGENHR